MPTCGGPFRPGNDPGQTTARISGNGTQAGPAAPPGWARLDHPPCPGRCPGGGLAFGYNETEETSALLKRKVVMNGIRDTFYRRAACHSIGRIVEADFTVATLITLHCTSAAIKPDFAKRLFSSWTYRARRIAGGAFPFIRVTDYGPISEIVIYVIADLPLDICCAACGEWGAGEASARPLDEGGVDRIVRAVICQQGSRNTRIWSYTGSRDRPARCALEQAQ